MAENRLHHELEQTRQTLLRLRDQIDETINSLRHPEQRGDQPGSIDFGAIESQFTDRPRLTIFGLVAIGLVAFYVISPKTVKGWYRSFQRVLLESTSSG